MEIFDWLKGLKKKAGKFSIKKKAVHLKHATFETQEPNRTRPRRS